MYIIRVYYISTCTYIRGVYRCTVCVSQNCSFAPVIYVYISFIPKEKDSSDEDSNCLKYLFADFLGN